MKYRAPSRWSERSKSYEKAMKVFYGNDVINLFTIEIGCDMFEYEKKMVIYYF